MMLMHITLCLTSDVTIAFVTVVTKCYYKFKLFYIFEEQTVFCIVINIADFCVIVSQIP